MKSSFEWKKLAAEGVVIIVSVLMALSADAWWSSRQDAQRADRHIHSLARDFDQMESRLEVSIHIAELGLQSSRSLLGFFRTGEPHDLADSSYFMAFRPLIFSVFSPSTGAYDAILSSGDLELIKNDSLKYELAQFFGAFEDLRVSERLLLDATQDFMQSDDFVQYVGTEHISSASSGLKLGAKPEQWSSVPGIRNGYALLGFRQWSVLQDYLFLSAAHANIQAMLDLELLK